MIRADMIPDEVVEAALEAYAHASGLGIIPYDDEDWHEDLVNGMRASIAAALSAWPGAVWRESGVGREIVSRRIVLPLPQEARDE